MMQKYLTGSAGILGALVIAISPLSAQSPTLRMTTEIEEDIPFLSSFEILELGVSSEMLRQSWFGWAGLNKVEHPPELPDELIAYREKWRRYDPAIAPFLGLWHDDEYSNNRYHLSIFPSTEAGYVCIVEFKPEYSVNFGGEEFEPDVISEGLFSMSRAKVGSAQLRGSNIRANELAITRTEFGLPETYPVELLPFYDSENNIRLVAAQGVPRLVTNFSDELNQTIIGMLESHNCILD